MIVISALCSFSQILTEMICHLGMSLCHKHGNNCGESNWVKDSAKKINK